MGPGCLVSPNNKTVYTQLLSANDSHIMLLKLIKNGIKAKFYDPISDREFSADPIDILIGQMNTTKTLMRCAKVNSFEYLTNIGLEATENDLHCGWAIECLYEAGEDVLDFDNVLTKEGVYYILPTRLPCEGFQDCFDCDSEGF